ncbi:MAG: hypothetical protein U0T79_01250 [Ferruginibacter sp.]
MKKISTLVTILMMSATSFAQYDTKDDWNTKDNEDHYTLNSKNDFDKFDNRFRSTYYFSARERDMQIYEINRKYDYKIRSVQSRVFMSRFEKMRNIRQLEQDRECAIKEIWSKFYDRRNMFNYERRKRHERF